MEFLYPYNFILLIFLVLFFKKDKNIFINPKLIANKSSIKFNRFFLALAYICMVVALSRPVMDKQEVKTDMNIKKVALALDISKSMLATDLYPNRLTFAKHKMEQFIDQFNGEISIMAFSNTAFLIAPYTTNKFTLKYLLDNIDTSYITSSGTDFNNLIKTAKKLGYKDLVIFSDGGDIKHLDTQGLNVYILLIGSNPAPIKLVDGSLLTKNGKVVMVGVNKNILNDVKFGIVATNSNNDIKSLISQNFKTVKKENPIYVYKELFIYPLALSVLFLFLGFFSLPKKNNLLPILILFITTQAYSSSIFDWYYIKKANEFYQAKDYNKSYKFYSKIDNDQAKFDAANSLYKSGQYKKALELYKQIKDKHLKAKVLYNEGNCLVKLLKIDEAIKKYEEVLKISPNDKDAKYNLELLKKQKKKTKPSYKKNLNQPQLKNNNKNKNNNNSTTNKTNNNSKPQTSKIQKPKSKPQYKFKPFPNKPQNIKPQEIKIKVDSQIEMFNRVKSKTLMIPLSQGEEKNEW